MPDNKPKKKYISRPDTSAKRSTTDVASVGLYKKKAPNPAAERIAEKNRKENGAMIENGLNAVAYLRSSNHPIAKGIGWAAAGLGATIDVSKGDYKSAAVNMVPLKNTKIGVINTRYRQGKGAAANIIASQAGNISKVASGVNDARDLIDWNNLNTEPATEPVKKKLYKKGTKCLKKYNNGVQYVNAENIRQKQEAADGIISAGAATGINAIAPGIGTAMAAVDAVADKALKDENGLYRNKAGQLANTFLNPMERIQSSAKAFGKAIKGDFKGAGKAFIGDQSDLKAAMEKDRMESAKKDYHNRLGGIEETSTQLEQAKYGRKKVKSKEILIEGGEPVFSKADSKGNRKLLYHNPDKSLSHKSGNDIPIAAPEGAAIVTNNDGKSDKAVQAYKQGDKKKLNKIINEMPTDKKKYKKGTKKLAKYDDGTDALKALQRKWGTKDDGKYGPATARAGLDFSIKSSGGWSTDAPAPDDLPENQPTTAQEAAKKEIYKTNSRNSLARSLYKPKKEVAYINNPTTTPLADNSNKSINFTPSNAFKDVDINGKDVNPVSASTEKEVGGKKGFKFDGSKLTKAAKATGKYAPTIYNIAAGLGGSEKETRRYYNPKMEKISDMSAPSIQAANEATKMADSNARNTSSGNAGGLRSNRTSNYNNSVKAKTDVYTRENIRQTEIANRNLERGNEAKKINLELDNKYDEMDKLNKAKKSEGIAKGLTGVSDILQNEELMDNQRANNDNMTKLLEMGRKYGINGVFKGDEAKNGVKAVKTYKKGAISVKVNKNKK